MSFTPPPAPANIFQANPGMLPPRDTQQVLNQSWPFTKPDGTKHAIGIEDKPVDKQIPVTIRVVFATDGETWLDGRAARWHGQCVFAYTNDKRINGPGVWVDAGDVRRR